MQFAAKFLQPDLNWKMWTRSGTGSPGKSE